MLTIKPIAKIHNDFTEKFGIPRQSGIISEAESLIVFEEEFRTPEALRGIEDFSHLWLIWQFSENENGYKPTVRPPRLGGNKRVGVFATRSPFRPNPLGISCVELKSVEKTKEYGTVLRVCGADLMNTTPIFDIKPYLTYSDCHINAVCGFTEAIPEKKLTVIYTEEIKKILPDEKISILTKILENDPRPSYHTDEREYTFSYANCEVSFFVRKDTLYVTNIKK